MLPSRGCQYGGSFLLLLAVETSMAPASATKIRLNDDSGWFCMSTSGAGEKCFRVVRPEADFVTHRDCALDICPSLDNGEASTTLGCISSEVEQAFIEEEIVEGGYMGDGTSSRYSTVHIGAFGSDGYLGSEYGTTHWVSGCSSDFENWHYWGDSWCEAEMCGSMITDSDYPDDDFQWHAKHCTSSTVLDSDPPYCLCEKGTAGPTQLYLDSIDEMEVATYDFSCAYIDSALVDYDLALLICMLLTTMLFVLFTSPAICKPCHRKAAVVAASSAEAEAEAEAGSGGEVEVGGWCGTTPSGDRRRTNRNLDSVLVDTRKQLEDFEEERRNERRRKYLAVSQLGTRFMFPGMFWVGFFFILNDPWLALVAHPVACLILTVGVSILSTCPVEDLDLDELLLVSFPKIRAAAFTFFSACAIVMAVSAPISDRGGPSESHESSRGWVLLSVVPGLWLASGRGLQTESEDEAAQHEATSSQKFNSFEFLAARTLVGRAQFGKPRPTTLVIATMLFLFLPWCLAHLVTVSVSLLEGNDTYQYRLWRKIQWSAVIALGCVGFACVWLQRRLTFRRTHGLEGWSPTLGAHMAVLAFMLTYGVFCLQHAIYETCIWPQSFMVYKSFAMGIVLVAPPLLVKVVGRQTLYAYLVRRVIREEQKGYGAFLATLIGKSTFAPGDLHYFERDGGTADERFDEDDPRRHWKATVVLEVKADAFRVVDLPDDPVLKPSQLAAEAVSILAKDSAKSELGVRTNALISAVFGPRRSIDSSSGFPGGISLPFVPRKSADDQPGRISMAFAPRLSAGSIGQPSRISTGFAQRSFDGSSGRLSLPFSLQGGSADEEPSSSSSESPSSPSSESTAPLPLPKTARERARINWTKGFNAVRATLRLAGTGQASAATPSAPTPPDVVGRWVPLHGARSTVKSKSAKDILDMGSRNFRCLDWSSMSFELLESGNSAGAEWNALSRPVKRGEIVDFFISHSWTDDAAAKWRALQLVATDFISQHKRKPTFWLDKACIDQYNVEDGLAVLPLNVMACEKMLILCGNTYPERLWCAWEICTLLSFITIEEALQQVVLVPLAKVKGGSSATKPVRKGGGGSDSEEKAAAGGTADGGAAAAAKSKPARTILLHRQRSSVFAQDHGSEEFVGAEEIKRMCRFDVSSARCYNPNEETRLRAVIDAVGRGAFNEKVRSLAVAVCTTPSARRSWDKESNDHAPEIVKEEFLSYVKNEGNEL